MRRVDGIALDLGVSSMQLNDAKRGFSFLRDGLLICARKAVSSAADLINKAEENILADIIFQYGEERHARVESFAPLLLLERADH